MKQASSNFPYNYFKCCLERNSESTIGSRSRRFDPDYVNGNRTSDDQEEVEEDNNNNNNVKDEFTRGLLGEYENDDEFDECEHRLIEETIREHVQEQQNKTVGGGGGGGGTTTNGYNTMNYIDVEKLIKSLGNDDKKIERLKKKLSLYIKSRQRAATSLSFEQSTMADATETGML